LTIALQPAFVLSSTQRAQTSPRSSQASLPQDDDPAATNPAAAINTKPVIHFFITARPWQKSA
jgi:hypothetical protein